jgi:hypothetical protein
LSFFQERIWRSCQQDPNPAAYFIPLFVELSGALDIDALECALNEIVRRHEILRTTYDERDGHPVQIVHEYQPLGLPCLDLSKFPDTHVRAKAIEQEESLRRPDIALGPLIRARLLKLGDSHHRLVLTIHHIVYDESGLQTFFQELDLLYFAYSHSESSPLEALPIQFGDFCVWQRRWFRPNERIYQDHRAFWTRYLAGGLHAVNLPFKREKPPQVDLINGIRHLRTNREFTEEMRAFAQQEGVTAFLLFLTAYEAVLSQRTGQEHFVLGTYASARSRPELEGQMGFFSNLLALRADLSGDPTFRELIQRARKSTLEAFEHRDFPFAFLCQELLEAGQEAPPVSALFTYTPPSDLFRKSSLAGVRMACRIHKKRRKYWGFSMSVVERARHVRFTLSFDTDIYEPAASHRMLIVYREFLQKVCRHPDVRLSQLTSVPCAPDRTTPRPV